MYKLELRYDIETIVEPLLLKGMPVTDYDIAMIIYSNRITHIFTFDSVKPDSITLFMAS